MMVGGPHGEKVAEDRPPSMLPGPDVVDSSFQQGPRSAGNGKTAEKVRVCPKCGERGSGPFVKRVGGNYFGLYFAHSVTVNGVRRIKWHYIRKDSGSKRREELLRLIASEGWQGIEYHARVLQVSERTIRRDVLALCSSGLLIHRRYGGYIADPTGAILKENPWLGW